MIVIALASPFFIEPLINSSLLKSRVAGEIENISGITLEPDNIQVSLFPLIKIRLVDFEHAFNRQLLLAIDSIEIDLKLLDLLNRQIAVDEIRIDGPSLIYTPVDPPQSPESDPNAPLPFRSITPEDVADTIFSLFPPAQGDLDVTITRAKTDYFDTMDARIRLSKTDRTLRLTSAIKGVDLARGRVHEFDRLTRNTINAAKVKGVSLEIALDNAGTLNGVIQLTRPEIRASQLPDKTLSAQELDVRFSLSSHAISASLAPAEFTYPRANVGIEFTNAPETGSTAITFTGKDIDIAQAREVCLPVLNGIPVSDALFDILRAGTAKHITVGFNARSMAELFNGENLVLEGAAAAARVKIPQVPLTAEHVFGSATVNQGILHIDAQRGELKGASIKSGTLDIDLLQDHDVPFSGKFDLAANLETLPQTLIDLLPETGLADELALVNGVSGQADGVLELNKPKDGELDVRVQARNINARGRYDRIPLPIHIQKGIFVYEENKVWVNAMSGTIGGNPFYDLDAMVSLSAQPLLTINTASATADIASLMPWLESHPSVMALLLPVTDAMGTLRADRITLEGPMFSPGQWQFSIQGTGTGVHLGFGAETYAVQDATASFDINEHAIDIRGIGARLTNLDWLAGTVPPDNLASIRLPLQMTESSIRKQKGKGFFHGQLAASGGPTVSFDLTGTTLSDLTPTLVVIKDPDLTDVMIIPNPSPDKPKISFEGRFSTLTLEKMLVEHSPLHRRLTALTAGDPITISTDTASRLHLSTERLNLDALLSKRKAPKPKSSTPYRYSRPLLAQKSLFLTADSLVFKEEEFTDVDGKVTFAPEKTRVQVRNADLCDLSARGYIDIFHGSGAGKAITQFDIKSLHQKDISGVLGCLFDSKSLIEGQYTLESTLKGQDTPDRVVRSQNGTLKFQARSGRIYKATLLSRVLSVLNILGDTDLTQKGFGYKTFTINATVKNSVIHLDKVYIDADNMAIIASGWADPLNDKLELTFLVAPFKTIDTIIQHIPLINTILSGRLVSFPAQASGKLSDPKVIPLHPSAVGKGLVNLFGDLIKAPVRLFERETPDAAN